MSEEVKEGMSSITKTVIGAVTTIVTVVSGYVVTNVEKIFGTEEKEKTEQVSEQGGVQGQSAAPAPVVINMTNNNTQQQNNSNGGGKTIIKETVREVPVQQAAPAATPVPEPKKETVAERVARLKREKAEASGEGK